ncbi:response regulator [bacterium]|nr:response regulator [bacterium]
MDSPVRVLVIDDHPLIRRGLVDLISREPDMRVSGEAEGLTEAFRVFNETQPSFVIVDITLKDGNGLEFIKEIKARCPHVRMLVSSMQDETLYAERCLRAGARGYINKEEAAEKIVDAIREIMAGKVFLSPELLDQVLYRMVGGEDASGRLPMDSLTDRELEVFELIGDGQTTRQIADRLDLSHKTIETYKENLKRKLNLKNATELNRHAVQWKLENK